MREIQTRRWTREEYHRMAEAGILGEDDRVELLDGEIVDMSAIGTRHAGCVTRLNHLFSLRLAKRALISIQNPIQLGEYSEPQPDVVLLRLRPDFYASDHPGPEDILLLVEVAETSAVSDRAVKLPLYARAGIPEVWLVILSDRDIEIHREPSTNGYQNVTTVRPGERLSPLNFPDQEIPVEEILG